MMRARSMGMAAALVLTTSWMLAGCGQTTTTENDAPAQSAAETPEPIELTTSDGLTVYGDLHRSAGARALLLLFHQAGGDGRGEYGPLLPRLKEAGYDALVIDQRVGGSRFGGVNRTALGAGDTEYGYCEVYPDLEAALAYAVSLDTGLPLIAWGSSYSAALVVRLAAEHGDELAGILAFSPASGEPLKDCNPLDFSENLAPRALFLRPASEMANERTVKQLEAFKGQGHETYVADPGVHGSSMLSDERVEGEVDETWDVVLGFLHAVSGKSS